MLVSIALACLFLSPMQDSRQAAIDDAIRTYCQENQVPSASYAIGERGQVVLSNAVPGIASDRIDTKSIYRLASISKPVTAVATLQLVEQGKIDLDADIRKAVPEWPDKGVTISARNLLGHLGGIRHYMDGKQGSYFVHFDDAGKALAVFKDDPLINQPGERYSYSTHAFTILARACENASKLPFPRLIRSKVAEPAGAPTLLCEDRRTANLHRVPLYVNANSEIRLATKVEDLSWKYGGGGIESTPTDLCRFAMAVLNGKLLKSETVDAMWRSQTTNSGEETGYGMGWSVGRGKYGNTAGHSGSQQGAETNMVIYRDRGVVIVVMTNLQGNPVGKLTSTIADIYFAK